MTERPYRLAPPLQLVRITLCEATGALLSASVDIDGVKGTLDLTSLQKRFEDPVEGLSKSGWIVVIKYG